MQRPPTIRDVAKLAGVSVCTVSNVINHSEQISRETAARVRTAILELNFTPRRHSKRVVSPSVKQVGMLFPPSVGPTLSGMTPLGFRLTQGAEEVFAINDINLVVSQLHEESSLPPLLAQHQLQGVIVRSYNLSPALLNQMKGLPAIWVLGSVCPEDKFDLVGVDNFKHGVMAARHLIQQRVRKAVVVSPERNYNEEFYLREEGFLWVTRNAGIKTERVLFGQIHPVISARVFKDSGIYCTGHDLEIEQLYQALIGKRLNPAGGLPMVCSATDAQVVQKLHPKMRVQSINPLEIGRTAANRLLWRLAHPHLPVSTILVPPLVN